MKYLRPFPLYLVCLSLLLICTVMSAKAEIPAPAKKVSLEDLNTKLADEKTQEKVLKKKIQNLKGTLAITKKDLISLAKQMKEQEAKLLGLQEKIKNLESQEEVIQGRLKKDQKSISQLLIALQRIRRTPPESVIVRPEAPLKTAQSAMLLQTILPGIHKRAESFRDDITRLDQLIQESEIARHNAVETSKELDNQHQSMVALLEERRTLYRKTIRDHEKQEQEVLRIAKQAQNLRDLLNKIEEKERTAKQHKNAKPSVLTKVTKDTIRNMQMPIIGPIQVGFGQVNDIGAESQGLQIEGRPKGLVISPLAGTVRYGGEFKNYGTIIIVEHKGGYHSLIAGLGQIQTTVGQSVIAGEPIGLLPDSSLGGSKPSLYYELRYKGQPINPFKSS